MFRLPLLYTTTTSLIYIWSDGGGSSGVIFFSLSRFIHLTRTYTHTQAHKSHLIEPRLDCLISVYIDGNVNHYQHHHHQHIMYISNGILFLLLCCYHHLGTLLILDDVPWFCWNTSLDRILYNFFPYFLLSWPES